MKFAFALFALLFSSTVIAKDLTVILLDSWKANPVAHCQVTLKSRIGQELFVVETDDQGKVTFSGLTYGIYKIVIADLGEDFYGSEYELKLKADKKINLILKVKQAFRDKQWAIEDSIYGKVQSLNINNLEDNDFKLDSVEVSAEFQAGLIEMKEFMLMNTQYPEISRELGHQGRVYVSFIVEPDGVITHINILESLTPELDEEAMRLVRSMPNLTPSIVNGEKVRSRCRLPITFTLH